MVVEEDEKQAKVNSISPDYSSACLRQGAAMSKDKRRRHGLVLGHRQRCPTGLDGLELRLPIPMTNHG